MCREGVLQIAASTFYERIAIERDPDLASVCASDCAKRDAYLCKEIKDVWEKNRSVYGARKLLHAPLGSILHASLCRKNACTLSYRSFRGVRNPSKKAASAVWASRGRICATY